MKLKDFKKLVRKWSGWIEGNMAYFPSVWHREQFQKEAAGH